MRWNREQDGWPNFTWDESKLKDFEAKFLSQSGMLIGASKHCSEEEKIQLTIEHMTSEALKSSEIEGEYLNRDSVQSSIRKNLGLQTDKRRAQPAEEGIAEMMVGLYRHFDEPLSHKMLYEWHKLLTRGRQDLNDIGRYRTHPDPMQVISGPLHKPKVHFEAPPSEQVKKEMHAFIKWYAKTAPNGSNSLPALTRTGIAHLYFVCIHPFEDGNGRIGRAIAEKSLSECVKQPVLIALSETIQRNCKAYYDALEKNNKRLDITPWLLYFAETILEAQAYTQGQVDFLIGKAKLYERIKSQLNARQQKAIDRIFEEGLDGFKGGLSADNYMKITGAVRATATRDLQGLVEMGALTKTGELKGTRYWLNI